MREGIGTPTRRTAVTAAVTLALLALVVSMTAATTAVAAPGDDLGIDEVVAHDAKTLDIVFDRALASQIRELTDGNPNYLRHWVRIDGDGDLDGRPLIDLAGSTVTPVDDGAGVALRVFLGEASLSDATYELWLDGGDLDLGDDLFVRAADGAGIGGTATPPVAFEGTGLPPELAEIDEVAASTSRVLQVTFQRSVIAGMPQGEYGGDGLTLEGQGGTLNPVYVEAVRGTDHREWRLHFAQDLEAGAEYELSLAGSAHALVTTGGTLADSDVLSATVTADGEPHGTPAIANVSTDERRSELIIEFDRKIAAVAGATETIEIIETPGGVSGVVLTDDDVRSLLQIDAAVNQNPGDMGKGRKGAAAEHLADVAGHFPDRRTLIVRLDSDHHFERGSTGTVTLRNEAAYDVTGQQGGDDGPHAFSVPNSRLPDAGTDYDPSASDFLSIDREASVEFLRNEFSFTDPPADYSVRSENVHDRLVTETIPAIVVENKYVEATFTPEYGGRMLSLIYKPTGNDLLYTNPVGVPYGFTSTPPGQRGNSPFYHNWLMVFGGVFPTVTEAEHGKYWFLPWDYEIEETDDAIAITVSITDDLHYADRPWSYNYGATGIETQVTYTVTKDSPAVDMDVSLHNPTDDARDYEYWVSATFAPGSAQGDGSPTMEVISNVETVQHIGWSPWMAQVEEPAPGPRMLHLDKLNRMVNWSDLGIAYGQDLDVLPQADWWGVVNHENSEGVIRVSDNEITHGMKFWMWGHDLSFDTNIYQDFRVGHPSSRPYIELWGGTSDEFFAEDTLGPGETKSWTETYLPTMDLSDVTNANAHGAADVRFVEEGGRVEAVGKVFPTALGQRFRAALVDVDTGSTIARANFTADPNRSQTLHGEVAPGSTVELVLSSINGQEVFLTAERTHG